MFHEAKAGQLEDEGPVELGLKCPVERFQRLARAEAAVPDAALNDPLTLAPASGRNYSIFPSDHGN